ncbi:biopolymer transporter ExbD [Limnohabitans sp. 2KL-17]|uniref:ExbD/TolR family protein n=1 Tax=Limnohabitans sp. 2KL-17 TaxID=1100704 RepID=UPI000D3387F0|nr:biopolymer transporter ExbD [Limnohabitans sp. 2KL-17]PUE53554.1 biopolymer transporter ExbD [Limnohabitans sp. 2KL-17]
MAMNLGPTLGPQDEDEVIGTINTTPLVDVMLVLLIIFLITIPVVTTSIKLDLPKEQNVVRQAKPETLIISVNKAGQIYLYDTPVKNTTDLLERLKKFSAMKPQPEVQIRGDAQSEFESVGRVMYAVQRAGITQVGFITDPAP